MTKLLISASLIFHAAVAAIVESYSSIKTLLGDILTDYNKQINALSDIGSKNLRLVNTRELEEKDKVRDAYIVRLTSAVSNYLKSPVAQEKANAQIVSDAISRFKGLSKYEMKKQTGEVQNMIKALREPQVMVAVDALDLGGVLTKLDAANSEFISAMSERIDGEAKKDDTKAKDKRKEIEATYAKIVDKLNSLANIAPTADSDDCIDRINALVKDYDRSLSRMRAGGAGNESLPKKDSSGE